MKIYKPIFFNASKRALSDRESSSWLVSYSDVVTVLLCFFIIFYTIEKSLNKKRTQDMLLTYETSAIDQRRDKTHPFVGPKLLGNKFEILKQNKNIGVIDGKDFTSLYFKDSNFFQFGQTSLTEEGKKRLNDIIKVIAPIQNKIFLTVIGHTDSIVIKKDRKRWWTNNMELSLARALDVRQYLIKNQISENNILIMGVGDQWTQKNGPTDSNMSSQEIIDLLKNDRKISIRIGPKEQK